MLLLTAKNDMPVIAIAQNWDLGVVGGHVLVLSTSHQIRCPHPDGLSVCNDMNDIFLPSV